VHGLNGLAVFCLPASRGSGEGVYSGMSGNVSVRCGLGLLLLRLGFVLSCGLLRALDLAEDGHACVRVRDGDMMKKVRG
jgi:hypothetical protein